MKLIRGLVCAGWLWAGAVLAQSPVTVTLGPQPPGAAIPADFAGLSFGMRALLPNKAGAHFFSPTNTALVRLFQNAGLRHLRLGGTTVESPPATPIPGRTEIDSLFGFVRAAQVGKVIYSLPLLETNAALNYAAANAALAKYIWDHYQPYLDSFSLGNEPDLQRVYYQDYSITNFETYLSKWRQFATAITNAVPKAKFSGPDGGSGAVSWTTRFARAEKDSGRIAAITEHFYVGGAGRGVPAAQGIAAILSPDWVARNQKLYDRVAVPVRAEGLPFRFTEANDHYSGGIPEASNTFAGALWALDFLHWWAGHGASGVDFHNTQWVANNVITPDANGRLTVTPKAYGIKAFDLGSHGCVQPITLSNPDGLNLTVYAVHGSGERFVTIINKEHGPGARAAAVTLAASGSARRATVLFLTAPNGDAGAKTGVTLGGAAIDASGPWRGQWRPLPATRAGHCAVEVPAVSAAIVRIVGQ